MRQTEKIKKLRRDIEQIFSYDGYRGEEEKSSVRLPGRFTLSAREHGYWGGSKQYPKFIVTSRQITLIGPRGYHATWRIQRWNKGWQKRELEFALEKAGLVEAPPPKKTLSPEEKKLRREAREANVPLSEWRTFTDEQRQAEMERVELCRKRAMYRGKHKQRNSQLLRHAAGRFSLLEIRPQLRVLRSAPGLVSVFARLYDLREAHPAWIASVIQAIRANRETDGKASKSFARGELDAYEYVQLCLRAHERHESTDYDALLRAGYSREDARACSQITRNPR